jgi:hypothetical protein
MSEIKKLIEDLQRLICRWEKISADNSKSAKECQSYNDRLSPVYSTFAEAYGSAASDLKRILVRFEK